jgi:hypothetical protein
MAHGGEITGEFKPARYAKDKVAYYPPPSKDGYKNREMRLAEAKGVRGKYSHREGHSFIMSKGQAETLKKYLREGRDASAITGELYDLDEMAKGGMMEHGLRIGDKVTDDMFWDNQIVVENQKTHKRAQINLETGQRKDEMAKGGELKNDLLVQFWIAVNKNEKDKMINLSEKLKNKGVSDELKDYISKNALFAKENFPKKEYDNDHVLKMVKMTISSYNNRSKYAMGGKVKFEDKVKAIKASLLKNKKVPTKVQKDYGKTYNTKEAEQAAKRIAGAMRKKEMK